MENQTNNSQDRFQKVNAIILDNEQFFIAVDGNSFDAVAAGSALRLMLESLGKKVALYSPVPIDPQKFSDLVGKEGFEDKVMGDSKKLLISFNCPLDAIEKVSSNDEGEKLSLTVEFKNGTQSVDPADVEVKSAGPEFSAGFIIGVNLANSPMVKKGSWIWLAKTGEKQPWAEISFVDNKASYSESIASMLSRTKLSIPVPAAQNLYLGIKVDTNAFADADSIALETAAFCLRIKEEAGAKPGPVPIDSPLIQEVENKEGKPVDKANAPIFAGTSASKI